MTATVSKSRMLAGIAAPLREAFEDSYDLDEVTIVTPPKETPPTPPPCPTRKETPPKRKDFWQGVRPATGSTKPQPWEFLSADLGAIFDTRNANWKWQYYRLWCKHHYPQDKDRWMQGGGKYILA
jgi:hypothetical protein